jgi:Fe2+ transport system protein FeoA
LALAGVGKTVTVTRLLGDEVFRGRMTAMGIAPGAPVVVVSGGTNQPLLIAVRGSRFMLDRQTAEMVITRSRRHCCERQGQRA